MAGVDLVQKSFIESNLYKISLESNTVKFEELSLSNNLQNFCIVQFHADFYLLQEADAFGLGDHKLTLHRIDKDGKLASATCLQKTGLETGFSGSKSRQAIGQRFFGPNF